MLSKLLPQMGFLSLLALSLSACQKDRSSAEDETLLATQSAANGATTRTFSFKPVLNLTGCIGYNIQVDVNAVVTILETSSGPNGLKHYTRHWRVTGLTATKVGDPTTVFNIVAGAEMFSVIDPNNQPGGNPTAAGSGMVFIHQGTIVLVNADTGEKIVARHQIIKNPGQGIIRSGWYMNGQKCGN